MFPAFEFLLSSTLILFFPFDGLVACERASVEAERRMRVEEREFICPPSISLAALLFSSHRRMVNSINNVFVKRKKRKF